MKMSRCPECGRRMPIWLGLEAGRACGARFVRCPLPYKRGGSRCRHCGPQEGRALNSALKHVSGPSGLHWTRLAGAPLAFSLNCKGAFVPIKKIIGIILLANAVFVSFKMALNLDSLRQSVEAFAAPEDPFWFYWGRRFKLSHGFSFRRSRCLLPASQTTKAQIHAPPFANNSIVWWL